MPGAWLAEVEEQARAALPPEVVAYVLHGAGDGVSAAEATTAWQDVRFVPRVLRDVAEVSQAVTLFGTAYATPLGIAPTTLQGEADPEGEVAMARAAAAAACPLVVSSNAGRPFAEVAATGAPWWAQVYVTQQRELCTPVLREAVAAGAEAVVLTADTPVVASKPAEARRVWDGVDPDTLRVNFGPRGEQDPGVTQKARDLGPDDVAWLGEQTGLPVVVKGVLGPDEARACVAAGAAGVWVSNHGGRQLDRAAATARVLASVADAVGGTVPVIVDGGVRSGLDALAALASGADAVMLGRVPWLALAAGGSSGVHGAWQELTGELQEALVLAGCRDPREARGVHLP